ncbi:acyl-CoA dehydrogenase NM domain-like protein [Hygrophoropsis aurantiaca]|uniref:Acyl-CoA dehydrogenase NM domain-like protein n=1 Tax=Hygrophoropsis aurantiaca TaxID=72124 RepID=A0ACB8AL87_9AGAM|nr:acyl-CoA dehydrogenase NM domain-like protein [Hygrophoropsis aurantiaca]
MSLSISLVHCSIINSLVGWLVNLTWKINHHRLSYHQRALLAYERAKLLGLAYGFSKEDLADLTCKFWDLHTDPLTVIDGAATTLLTIQYNLAAGTLVQHSEGRADVDVLIDDLLTFKKIGQFMLTEVGHGLDVGNLETTATRLPSGDYSLHTPTLSAAKFMPPTVPVGTPTIGIVFARLLVDGEDRGIRPFLVPLNDGDQMCAGVTARLMPYRELSSPVNHSITTFDHVRLPGSALLGSLEKSMFPRLELLNSMWRVAIGSIALGSIGVPAMKVYSAIGASYSRRRFIGSISDQRPLLSFRTQQIPVLTAVARTYALDAFRRWAVAHFSDTSEDPRVRHGIAACFKAVAVQFTQCASLEISERCGAQGIQSVNMMTNMHAEMRGIAIAEGDILGLSIRLVTELLLERYRLPISENPQSLLARHEAGLFKENRTMLASAPSHRSPEFSKFILPRCQPMVEAIGHRMAYDAAAASGMMPSLLHLYECSIVKLDPAWYVENAALSRRDQDDAESRALDDVLPHLTSFVEQMDIEPYVRAPIRSDTAWDAFVNQLEVFEGAGHVSLDERGALMKARL